MLGLAITGIAGFLLIRPAVYDPDDAATTLQNLLTDEGRARLYLGVELASSSRRRSPPCGSTSCSDRSTRWPRGRSERSDGERRGDLASSAAVATALEVAADAGLAPGEDAAATAQLLFQLSESFWSVGALFFGLWLIPMGWVAATCGRFPPVLGWVLVAGGVAYVVSAFVENAVATTPASLAGALTIPATIGEFWMIGYLLMVGIRPAAERQAAPMQVA